VSVVIFLVYFLAHVGDHIFRELVCKYLVGRTRILVTHQIALVVPVADRVLCLDSQGGVAAFTKPALLSEELAKFTMKALKTFSSLPPSRQTSNENVSAVRQTSHESVASNGSHHSYSPRGIMESSVVGSPETDPMEALGITNSFFDMIINISKDLQAKQRLSVARVSSSNLLSIGESKDASPSNDSHSSAPPPSSPKKKQKKGNSVKLVQSEEKSSGSIGWHVYWFYLSAGGGSMAVLAILAADILIPLSWFAQNYSLSKWLGALEMNASLSTKSFFLVVYLVAVLFVLFCTICKQLFQMVTTLRASRQLHEQMLVSVLGATVSWHDSQPSGRKTNRFSQDIYELDNWVMIHMQEFFDCLFGTAQVVFVVIVMIPMMVPLLLPVLLYDYMVASKFVVASRELKRLESVNKSPVFVLFSESMSGISVIRACRQESRFFDLCCERVDVMVRCHLYMWGCGRWLNFRTQFMSAVVVGLVALMVVLNAESIGSSIAGLTLVYALSFTDNVTFLARMHSECQMSLNSVERIMEYLGVDQERYNPTDPFPKAAAADREDADDAESTRNPLADDTSLLSARVAMKRRPSWDGPLTPAENWPVIGTVQFDNISMRYRPKTPLVLKYVS
jgi:ABC-type multidrug transport system fused ATPase/permease subunit